MPTNDREYARKYAAMRRWLWRLEHPKKQAGRKLGSKDKVPRKKRVYVDKPLVANYKLGKFEWDRT